MDKEYAEFLLEKTRRDYNLIAREFAMKREEGWEETNFLLDNYLKPGDKILDLGCGHGRYFPLFRKKNVQYFGIDSSEELINIAKENYPAGSFQVGEALNLPFSDNFFNKIYSIAVLHHLPSDELRLKFLKEAKRVLGAGGLLILTVWKFHEKKEIFLLFKYTILKFLGKTKLDFKDILEPWAKQVDRYYHWFSEKELRRLVERAGFIIRESGIIENRKGNRQNIYLIAEKSS